MRVNLLNMLRCAANRLVQRANAFLPAGAVCCLVVTASFAATTTYEYDALGRLKRVTRADGATVIYTLDPAGNRSQVETVVVPGAPPVVYVPATSTTGSYKISWEMPSGNPTHYVLYEATNASFSGQTLAYSGQVASANLSGRGNGTYYYRVRACVGSVCGPYAQGTNPVQVTLPPEVPAGIVVPATANLGSYTITWSTSTGIVGAYELYEATNVSFSGQVQVYSGTVTSHAFSNKPPGTYYYQVRACNTSECSDYRAGSDGVTVPVPIEVLNPSIHVTGTTMTTSIVTLANLNGNPGTIHSFSVGSCSAAAVAIESGAQSIRWTNFIWYYRNCDAPWSEQCSATYVIRDSATGQLHDGSSAVTVTAYARNLPRGTYCP